MSNSNPLHKHCPNDCCTYLCKRAEKMLNELVKEGKYKRFERCLLRYIRKYGVTKLTFDAICFYYKIFNAKSEKKIINATITRESGNNCPIYIATKNAIMSFLEMVKNNNMEVEYKKVINDAEIKYKKAINEIETEYKKVVNDAEIKYKKDINEKEIRNIQISESLKKFNETYDEMVVAHKNKKNAGKIAELEKRIAEYNKQLAECNKLLSDLKADV